MERRIPTARHLRTGAWALALAAGLTIAGGSVAGAAPMPADGLPLPVPALPSLPVQLPPVPALPAPVQSLVGTLTAPLTGTKAPTTTGSGSAQHGAATSSLPSQVTSPLAGVGTQLKSTLDSAHQAAKGTPLEKVVPNGAPGSVLNLGVNLNPLATACVQATGSGTAVANTTVTVGGQNITAPLVQALPDLLAACPAGAVPSKPGVTGTIGGSGSGSGSGTSGTGGTIGNGGLVGLCVSIDKAPPLKATILALNTDLLAQLTSAGVPLQQVVVPCPKGAPGTGTGGGTNPGGGTHTGGTTGSGGTSTGSNGLNGAAGAGNGNGSGNGNSCAAAPAKTGGSSPLSFQSMGNLLPHSPASSVPWLILAALIVLARNRIGGLLRLARPARAA